MALNDQVPVHSKFNAKSTGAQVLAEVDLEGRVAVVTGGYSGIGLETVRALAGRGVKVIVPARDRPRAVTALASLDGEVELADMDLGDVASVRRFAQDVKTSYRRLDLLINNAGIMACPEWRLAQGWESQFGINHLGHMALAMGLMDLLQKTAGARVVALSSTGRLAYGQSKTANALFANALSRRLRPSGGHAFSVHPGGIFTPLQRHLSREEQVRLGWVNADGSPSELAKAGFKSIEQGCATTLWAATSSALADKPGVYCEDCDIASHTLFGSPYARYRGVEAHACDDETAERLWEMSEAMLSSC